MSYISVRGEQSTTAEIAAMASLAALPTDLLTFIVKSGPTTFAQVAGGSGDFVGPGSSTDNAIVRFDSTTGKLGQNSIIIIDDSGNISPATNDTGALGTATLKWADLFLASGGVINFNNGNVTLTHSAGVLTLGGTATFALGANSITMTGSLAATGARVTKGWFTDLESTNMPTVSGVAMLTISSTDTLTNKTLTSPKLNENVAIVSTATQVNYLASATGTTGTTTTNLVFSTSPTLVTPVLGVASATSINKITITAPATGATITIIEGKTLKVDNTLEFAGTDATVMTFPTTSATIARTDAANTFTGASTASAWVLTSPTITTKISPTTDDGAPLGDTTHNFSDLFLASGAVINFNNGDVTITHAANLLTFAGGQFTFGANTAYFAVTDNGNSGTSKTVDWTLGNKQKITMTGNCTFTFTAPGGPASIVLELIGDGTVRTPVWPASVKWSGGTAPTLTGTSGRSDIIALYYNGTVYYATSTLNHVNS